MSIGERIKKARKRAGISQAELAKRVGRSQSAVAEWETEETSPLRNIVPKIAKELGVDVVWLEVGGVNDGGDEYEATPGSVTAPGAPASLEEVGPIYANVEDESGKAEQIIEKSEIVEQRPKPSRWANVKGIYGFYIVTDTLAPRINPGELVWVHPHRRPLPGQEAVFVRKDKKGKTAEVMVKVFTGQTQTKWVVKQYNPKKEFDLKKSEWDCQLIINIDLNR